jgi:hypothetical protein
MGAETSEDSSIEYGIDFIERLLDALGLAVRTYESIEEGEHMAPVIDDARENITELRVAFRLAVPFGQDCGWNFDVSPQLFRGITAQEEAIEKGRLTLWEVKIVYDFGGNELWHRGHRERCSLPKTCSASSRTRDFLTRCR